MSSVELYFCCLLAVRRLFLLHKTCEIFRHFLQLYQKKQPLALGVSVADPFSGVYHVVLTLLYRISQTSSKVGQR